MGCRAGPTGLMKTMGCLVWCAAAAAAHEHKAAKVHHTATGQPARRLGRTAELSVITDDLHLKLTLEADFGAFHRSYKELAMGPDGATTTRAGARGCHYKGSATDTKTGEGGRVTARTCAGYPEAVVRMDGGRVLELAWRDGAHAVFDPSDDARPRTCGVDPERHAPHPPDTLRRRHLRGEHDHDDHGHGHDHHDLFQRSLGANECAAGPTKYVGIVVFNDEKRYARHGADVEAHTAALFDVMYDIYTEGAPYGLYDGDKMNCRVVPVLIGQVTWRDGNPDCSSCTFDNAGGTYTRSDGSHGMYYARGPEDCAPCGDTCSTDEVSATCLLDSLTVYVARERAALESALGVSIDSSILLSGEDFSATTAGLAWMNGLCVDTWSGSVVEDSGSVAVTAAVMAHELGHLLGMGHDEGGPNIMQAVMTSGDPHDTGMQFRDLAREEADGYFTSKYGSSNFWPTCLNENVETSWDTPVCGDGIVDAGEECDPGVFFDDTCCSSACLLEAGCECANSDACCTNGAFTAATEVCRPAQHDECDKVEYCTGKMGDCPVDLYEKPGKDCTEEIFPDDSDAKSDEDGKCYRGKCISQAGSCIDPNTGGAIYDDGTPHTSYCDSVSDCSITYCSDGSLFAGCIGYNEPARDGMECGSGKVCRTAATDLVVDLAASPAPATSSCVDEQDLKDYHWSFGDDGCREPVCLDERGVAADPTCTVCCEGAAPGVPQACSVAPTISPPPSVSPVPTGAPSVPPTPAPTSTFAPTSLKDDDFDETAARVLGLALKWFIVVLVAVMVALVGLVWLCTCAAKLCKTKQKPAKQARAPPRPPPRAQALQSPLPRNWSRQVDGMSGKTYYVNHATGATSWERPI